MEHFFKLILFFSLIISCTVAFGKENNCDPEQIKIPNTTFTSIPLSIDKDKIIVGNDKIEYQYITDIWRFTHFINGNKNLRNKAFNGDIGNTKLPILINNKTAGFVVINNKFPELYIYQATPLNEIDKAKPHVVFRSSGDASHLSVVNSEGTTISDIEFRNELKMQKQYQSDKPKKPETIEDEKYQKKKKVHLGITETPTLEIGQQLLFICHELFSLNSENQNPTNKKNEETTDPMW